MFYTFLRFSFLFLLFQPLSLSAYKCISVEDAEVDGNKWVCVCIFDTEEQEYTNIDYYERPLKGKKLIYEYTDNDSLHIFYNGSVEVFKNFDIYPS